MLWSSAVLFALIHSALSKPLGRTWDDFKEKHSWIETPPAWELQGPAPADHTLTMRIGLKQGNLDGLISSLYEVSDPSSKKYGAHLSAEEVDKLVAPHSETTDLVESWLAHHGISTSDFIHKSSGGDYITVLVPVEQAERMLDTKYNVYRHSKTGEDIVRTMSYSLPSALHGHVDVVTPTTYFSTFRSMKSTSFIEANAKTVNSDAELGIDPGNLASLATVPASCATTITPTCLRALYNTSTYVPKATSTNKLGVAGYLDEFANFADLQTFFQRFRTDAVGANFTVVQINGGGNDQTDPGVEANLDIQYTEGISFPTPNIYYSTGGSPPFIPDSSTTSNTNEPYLDFLNFITAQSTVPQTLTTSYGDDEQTVPSDYATNVCNLFAQLGARGVSIMFSSGDSGVGAGDCRTNDGTNKVLFQPAFPAGCPFVTAVGGTTGINPEVAVKQFGSGGGFSRLFSQPSYQSAAVSAYLTALGTTNAGLFTPTGRAYPDVAAQGQSFQVVIGGRTSSVGGTSASSPTFAGVVSLLNDFRISSGKAPLGFLNPLLYANATSALNDVTSGNNPGCGTNGFPARAGWDPVTGLGTPDFGKLQAVVAKAA